MLSHPWQESNVFFSPLLFWSTSSDPNTVLQRHLSVSENKLDWIQPVDNPQIRAAEQRQSDKQTACL